MSMNRVCKSCGMVESIRFNFGSDREFEANWHSQDWHDCDACNCKETKADWGGRMCFCKKKTT